MGLLKDLQCDNGKMYCRVGPTRERDVAAMIPEQNICVFKTTHEARGMAQVVANTTWGARTVNVEKIGSVQRGRDALLAAGDIQQHVHNNALNVRSDSQLPSRICEDTIQQCCCCMHNLTQQSPASCLEPSYMSELGLIDDARIHQKLVLSHTVVYNGSIQCVIKLCTQPTTISKV